MLKRIKKEPKKSEPVAPHKSIVAAFARQFQGKVCTICNNRFSLVEYRLHFDKCQINSNDIECEVVSVILAEEKKLLAKQVVNIDDDADAGLGPSDLIPGSVLSPTNLSNEVESSSKTVTTTVRRRSSRLTQMMENREQISNTKENCSNISPTRSRKRTNKAVKPTNEDTITSSADAPSNSKKRNIAIKSPKKDIKKEGDIPSTSISAVVKQEKITVNTITEKITNILMTDKPYVKPEIDIGSIDEEKIIMQNNPYFVSFMLEAIQHVLTIKLTNGKMYDESFWGDNLGELDKFVSLSSVARRLFMRVFLRKRAWLTIERLRQRYPEFESNIEQLFVELEKVGFVESAATQLTDLEQALHLLPLPSLKNVAKIYKLDGKNKLELNTALVTFSNKQQGIFGHKGSVAKKMLETVKKELGLCYRLAGPISNVLKSILTLYSPTETSSALAIDSPNVNIDQSLFFTMLQLSNGQLRVPAPRPCTYVINIYENRSDLDQYIESKNMEIAIMMFMTTNHYTDALKLCEVAREYLNSDCNKSIIKRCSLLKASLRRFTAPWVMTRCVSHGATVLERLRAYAIAVEWQRCLLQKEELQSFCMESRGAVWERLALNLESHLKEKEEALEAINLGLQDVYVREKDQLSLQDRGRRLDKNFKIRIPLEEPKEVEIEGKILSKGIGDPRVNRFISSEDGTTTECSVEEIARRHYIKNENYPKGVHAEGSIWHTVLGLLFYDSIFSHEVPDAWLSVLQTHPCDLNSPDFFLSRQKQFEKRLQWLSSADDDAICEEISKVWLSHNGVQNSEISWELFDSPQECVEFIASCPRGALLGVCNQLLRDYRACRSGFPDLTFWNAETRQVAVVEVKGPGDRLSTKQRLWLDRFRKWSVRADVCYVLAKKDKRLEM